jgi:hypothetical protein
LWSVGF